MEVTCWPQRKKRNQGDKCRRTQHTRDLLIHWREIWHFGGKNNVSITSYSLLKWSNTKATLSKQSPSESSIHPQVMTLQTKLAAHFISHEHKPARVKSSWKKRVCAFIPSRRITQAEKEKFQQEVKQTPITTIKKTFCKSLEFIRLDISSLLFLACANELLCADP